MTPSVIATGAKAGRRRGEERHGEAQQAVGAGLQQQAGENDAAGGRRLGMSIGQPGMERHAGSLTAKAMKKPSMSHICVVGLELRAEPARNSRM